MAFGARAKLKHNFDNLNYGTISSRVKNAIAGGSRWEKSNEEVNLSTNSSKNYALRMNWHLNPVSCKQEEAACMRLYATDILQYFEDGTIVVDDYDSSITRQCLNMLGPVCVGAAYPIGQYFMDIHRGMWPMREPLVIRPDGVLQNVVIQYKRHRTLKPALRAERLASRKLFLEGATARLILGEFPEIISGGRDGWMAEVPHTRANRHRMFEQFCFKADHNKILQCFGGPKYTLSRRVFGRRMGDLVYDTQELAAKAFMRALMSEVLNGNEFYDTTRTETEHRDIVVVRR